MNYRRALLLADLRVAPGYSLAALRRVAPGLERIVVVARQPSTSAWWSREESDDQAALDNWRTESARVASSIEVHIAPELPPDALIDLALHESIDLLVSGTRSLEGAGLLTSVGRHLAVAVLWPAGEQHTRPIERVFCSAIAERSRASLVAFLREHAGPSLEVSVVGPPVLPPDALAPALEVAGIHARVVAIGATSLGKALDATKRGGPVDLLVFTRLPAALLVGYAWPAPVLLVPRVMTRGQRLRPLDTTDAVDIAGATRVLFAEVTPLGQLSPAADLPLAIVSDGRVVTRAVTTPSGQVELSTGTTASSFGVVRDVDDAAPDTFFAMQQRFALLRPTSRALLLFDSELPDELLRALSNVAAEPLAVRLRPTRRAAAIRARIEAAGIRAHLVDARAVLDEGEAHDVSEANDPVRLRRVAARMRAAGFSIAGVFDKSVARPEPLLDAPAVSIAGNRIELELDNAKARAWLVDAMARSRHSVNVQVYMALDDDVGRAVERALSNAATRGVAVRVLVDSLHGMHGSFGAENPLLARLAAQPGIELRVSRPLTTLPSVTDLKQRDHRKIVIVDDRIALTGGRNLSHEYYTGFAEARLGRATHWRQVPWLDAGARIEGPAVAAIQASFLEAWTEAGGARFAVESPAPAGSTIARVVVHRGLRDARTLETYLELIERAQSHIYAVNGFPYVLELQHALLGALRRGVRVRALTGHLTPTHDGTPFAGPWSSARIAATEFVHSRLDPIVDQGGDVFLFAQHAGPSWEPGLHAVYPHVHAKVMSIDGVCSAVGSANFDVTSSYWESDLTLVVDDPALAAGFERRLDELIAGATRVHRDDPTWRERARRRAWMRKWPGVFAI